MTILTWCIIAAAAFYLAAKFRVIDRAERARADAVKEAQDALEAAHVRVAGLIKNGQALLDAYEVEKTAIAKAAREALRLDDAARVTLCEQLAFPPEEGLSLHDQAGPGESHLP